jgi:hypothetical protein
MMPRKRRGNCTGLQILTGVIRLTAIASFHAAGFLGTFSKPAQAAEQFDNSGIRFDVDTVVEFQFVKSEGAYQSTFGVINLDTGEKTPLITEVKPSDNPQDVNTPTDYSRSSSKPDFPGTPGNTVPQPLPEFAFKANTRYAFYLESTYNGRPAGILYSTNAQNPGGNQQVKFQGGISALGNAGTVILWDDTGSVLVRPREEDRDFNDFIVRAGGHLACPYAGNVSGKQQSEKSYELRNSIKCTGK